jgi:hypothetical protein
MFQHMRDAAGSAGKMKIEKRTEQSPTQAGPVGDGDIDLAYGRDTLADEVKGFAPQLRASFKNWAWPCAYPSPTSCFFHCLNRRTASVPIKP